MARTHKERSLARGRAEPQAGDEDLIALFPNGEWQSFRGVRDVLASAELAALTTGMWPVDDAWLTLPWVCTYVADERLADAVRRGVLAEHMQIVVRLEHPVHPWLTRLARSLRASGQRLAAGRKRRPATSSNERG